MKTILVSTDLSASARHAAEYGYQLASLLKTNVVLCNAVTIPAATQEAAMISWPVDEYDTLMDGSKKELHQLKKELEQISSTDQFKPQITCISEDGILADVVNQIAAKQPIDLVVIATHGHSGLTSLILGDHCHNMITELNTPLLIVPPAASVADIKKNSICHRL